MDVAILMALFKFHFVSMTHSLYQKLIRFQVQQLRDQNYQQFASLSSVGFGCQLRFQTQLLIFQIYFSILCQDYRLQFYHCMGNTNDSKIQVPLYKEIRVEEHELLSNIVIVESENGEKLIVKQLSFGNQIDYQKMIRQFRQRKLLSDKKAGKGIIQLKNLTYGQMNQICGKTFKITLYLEQIKTNLRTLLLERMRNNLYFSEGELLSFLRCVVVSLLILHDNNYKNIHIYKETILLGSDGNYKLMDTQLCWKIHPYFEILNSIPVKTGTYLAPELLEEITKQNQDFYNTPKADIFTLGVVLLEMCTMKNYDAFYNYEKRTVNIDGLHYRVNEIGYSHHLKSILHGMLAAQEDDRIGLISLKEMLGGNNDFNEQSYTYKAYSESNHQNQAVKQTARTFITRSKPDSANKLKSKFIEVANKPINQFSSRDPPAASNNKINRPLSEHSFHQERQPQFFIYPNHHTEQQKVTNHKIDFSIDRNAYSPTPTNLMSDNRNRMVFAEPVRHTPQPLQINYESIGKKIQLPSPVNYFQLVQNDGQVTPIRQIEGLSTAKKQQLIYPQVPQHELITKKYGKYTFSTGAFYEGEMNQDQQFDGNGMLYYPNGRLCYSGSWKNNCFHGFGVLYNERKPDVQISTNYQNFKLNDSSTWSHYEGQFVMDKKQGFGTLLMHNGDKFSGCFRGDAIEGFGTFYHKKQARNVNGIWVDDVLRH